MFSNCFSSRHEKGNALFLVLIAVALFAALSYAVTQTGRGGKSLTPEQTSLYAAQVVQTGADITQTVQRMILSGTPATSVVAGTPGTTKYPGGGAFNGFAEFCTSGATCVFAPGGGGAPIPSLPRNAFVANAAVPGCGCPFNFSGPGSFYGVTTNGLMPGAGPPELGIQGIGTAANDDLLEILPLKREVCQAINTGLGIAGIPVHNNTILVTVTAGKDAACLDWNGDGSMYLYYQVLIAN